MQCDLGVQGVRKQAALDVIQRDAGLVAGRFDAQYKFHDAFAAMIVREVHCTFCVCRRECKEIREKVSHNGLTIFFRSL